MKKVEQVFREMLYQAIECKNRRLTQLELSKKLKVSLSTVNLAVKKLDKMGAVIIEKMGFRIIDIKKILYYWASTRNLERDIVYKTRTEMPIREIERNIPNIVFAGYSAYKFKFKDVPADYSEVYIYADEKETKEIKKRFSENNKFSNLFVLKKDKNMDKYGKTCTAAQIFVDLWNLDRWYASDFLKAFKDKLNLEE